MKSLFINSLKAGSASVVLGVALLAAPAMAQNTDNSSQSSKSATAPEIVVTGSAIKRLSYDTPSPVDVISSKDLASSGYNQISTILTNLTANGAGTLSANNSEAFAGGAAGIALRGLDVGYTLTLIDGQRMAPYPLSDDGERQFVDVNSIPIGMVDSVDILKDGASSLYGSNAIAGVVNIKLKKQIVGLDAIAEGGTSQHGGDDVHHFALSWGTGDLATDGHNFFISTEYRDNSAVTLGQRSYQPWANLDFRPYGGIDNRPGAPNFLNGNQPATRDPYLVDPSGNYHFLNPTCNTTALNAHQCAYTNPLNMLEPMRDIAVMVGYTRDFGNGWEAKIRASFFDSRDYQSNPYSAYPSSSYGGNDSNQIGQVTQVGIGAIANYTTPVANMYGTNAPAGSYLQGVLAGFQQATIENDSKTYRLALDLTGKLWGWDTHESMSFSDVVTDQTFMNFVNYTSLYGALGLGGGAETYNPLGGNSSSVLNSIAPSFTNTASDRLFYADADASRKLMDLPGGDLHMAIGAQAISTYLNNPGPAPVLSGAVGGTFSTYAIGEQTDIAAYGELDAHIFHTLEIDASARDDWYDTYGNSFTPKVGLIWKPVHALSLRGTFSKGFRAPAPAEFGQSGTLFGLGGYADPVLCPNGNAGPFPKGTVPATCTASFGYVQTTTPTLKPETSTEFTGGSVLNLARGWTISADYYHIQIDNQIVAASELPSFNLFANCQRGPDLSIPGVADGNGGLVTAVPIAGPLAACFSPYVNAQSTVTSGLDLKTNFVHHLDNGATISASLEWSHIFNWNMTAPNGITYHLVGTHGPSGISGDTGNPQDRLNGTLSYAKGPFSTALSGYWIGSYSVLDPSAAGQSTCAGAWNGAAVMAGATPNSTNSGFCRVKSFASFNLTTAYQFDKRTQLYVTVDNLFDAGAPVDTETYGGYYIPVNPALAEDGIIGRSFMIGIHYKM